MMRSDWPIATTGALIAAFLFMAACASAGGPTPAAATVAAPSPTAASAAPGSVAAATAPPAPPSSSGSRVKAEPSAPSRSPAPRPSRTPDLVAGEFDSLDQLLRQIDDSLNQSDAAQRTGE